jgi:RNA polymerase sigma factor (sigma-70 family)
MTSMSDPYLTRHTLIERAKDQQDGDAWEELEAIYRQYIYVIIRSMNVHSNHADDVLQQVFIKVWTYLPKYEPHDASTKFRYWVAQITRSQVISFFRQQSSHSQKIERAQTQVLLDTSSNLSPSDIEQQIERDWEIFISNKAMEKVSQNFSPLAIQAFLLFAKGEEVKNIATQLEAKPDSIYKYISRIKLRLTEEVKVLLEKVDF